MPVYVYETILPNGAGGERFELQQSVHDPALNRHPLTDEPVRRVLFAPNLATRHTPGKTQKLLDNRNVEKAGFTKYERDRLTGTYHRVAGKEGPASFRKPE